MAFPVGRALVRSVLRAVGLAPYCRWHGLEIANFDHLVVPSQAYAPCAAPLSDTARSFRVPLPPLPPRPADTHTHRETPKVDQRSAASAWFCTEAQSGRIDFPFHPIASGPGWSDNVSNPNVRSTSARGSAPLTGAQAIVRSFLLIAEHTVATQ